MAQTELLPGIDEVLIVPQFHYDIAYLLTEEEYYPRAFDNLREAISLMDAHPEYRYTVEQPFLLEQFRRRCPEDFARLKACHARGQLEVSGALYLIPDMNMPSGESLVRQALWGRRWVREHLGDDVRTAWIADTWGHPPTVPQIMRHCGINAYFFTRAMRPEGKRGDFVWVGLDGTELVAHWLPAGYATLSFPQAAQIENALELDLVGATVENLRALAARLQPFLGQRTLLLCSGGDMARPQASAPAVVARWQADGLPVRFGAIREYVERLRAHQDDLPRLAGEFNPLFLGTQASRIRLKLCNRRLENALTAAEREHAALCLTGNAGGALGLGDAWATLLKNQFHDTISGTIVDAAYEIALREYEAAFRQIEARLQALEQAAGVGGVFNPSAWERTEWVSAQDGQGTAPVMVPALSWAETPAVSSPPQSFLCDGNAVLENEWWRVTVGTNGTLVSVVDVHTGQEFVAPNGPGWGDLVYRNDNGDLWLLDNGPLDGGSAASALTETRTDDPYRRSADPLVNDNAFCQHSRPHNRVFTRRDGEQSVVVSGSVGFWFNSVAFETTVTLRAGDPLIHFRTTALPKGRRYRVYACFPTPWPDAVTRHQVAFGAAERDDRRYVAQGWAEAVAGDGHGVRLLNSGTPGNALNNGILSLLLFRSAAMEYKAVSEQAFEEGQALEFSYAVRPFTPEAPGEAEREAERVNCPLRVTPNAGNLPPPLGFSLTPAHVQVSAFYALDGGEFLLRVYECSGQPASGLASLSGGFSSAWESDGLETRGTAVELDGGALPFALRPWQIAAWCVRPRLGETGHAV